MSFAVICSFLLHHDAPNQAVYHRACCEASSGLQRLDEKLGDLPRLSLWSPLVPFLSTFEMSRDQASLEEVPLPKTCVQTTGHTWEVRCSKLQ